jgi:hypothetical protein
MRVDFSLTLHSGQPQAPAPTGNVTQISDGQPQAPTGNFTAPNATAPAVFPGAASTPAVGIGAFAAALLGLVALL